MLYRTPEQRAEDELPCLEKSSNYIWLVNYYDSTKSPAKVVTRRFYSQKPAQEFAKANKGRIIKYQLVAEKLYT